MNTEWRIQHEKHNLITLHSVRSAERSSMAEAFTLNRRIGSTNYTVNVNFSGNESVEDRIVRLISNNLIDNDENCGIIDIPQMSRQSERSA